MTPSPGLPKPRRHPWRRWLWLAVPVLLAHACVGQGLLATISEWKGGRDLPPPLEMTVQAELRPAEPPVVASPPPPPPAPPAAVADPAAPYSPQPAASAVPPPTAAASAPLPDVVASAPVEAPPAPVAAAEPVQELWPPSIRVKYDLRGQYRGEFSGSAQVLWLREGNNYQVHLDLVIGPRAAPIMSRRVMSEGRLTPSGLLPQRYDEETKVLFTKARRNSITFERADEQTPGVAVLADGKRRPAEVGTQDAASQFVQLAWILATKGPSLKPGDRVGFPLALPRRSDPWSYTFGEPVKVDTPAGPVDAIHARPQRDTEPVRKDIVAETWFAPSLRYLPVRMRVFVDDDTYADLNMDGLPEVVSLPFFSLGAR